MRVLRWLLFGLVLLVALPVVAVTGALIWANTEPGRNALARLAEGQVAGLHIEGLRGPLPGHPSVARLVLSDDQGPWLELEEARIDLDLAALLHRTLRIRTIAAQRIALFRLPPSAPAAEPTPPGETVLPQLPSLPVDIALDRLAIEKLELGAPVLGQDAAFAIAGEAGLAAGDLRARLDLRRLDREGNVALALGLTPAEDRLSAKVTAREAPGGLVATLAGLGDRPLALDLTLEGPASGAELRLDGHMGEGLTLTAQGRVRAAPDGALGATLSGEASAPAMLPPDAAPLATPLAFRLDADLAADQRLALRTLEVRAPAGQLGLAGTANLANEALDLRATLDLAESQRFVALLPPGPAWQGLRAEAAITGTMAAPSLDLTATPQGLATGQAPADAVLGPTPRLSLKAAMPGPRLDLALEGAEGRLAANGSLAEPIALTATLELPRLAVLGGGSEGALSARVEASGRLADPDLVVFARSGRIAMAGHVLEALELAARIATPASAPRGTADLNGRLDGLPLALTFRGQPDGSLVRFEQATARLGPATLQAQGVLDPAGPVFTGEAKLDASDLAPLGRLAGQPSLGGRLGLEAKLAPRDGLQGFDIGLEAPRLSWGETAGAIRATLAGTPAAMEWSIDGTGPELGLNGKGRLAQAEGGWRLDLNALDARGPGETLRLAGPAQVRLGADGSASISSLAFLLGSGGRLRAEGRWGPERADITANLAGLPLGLAAPYAPGVDPRGTISGDLRVTGPVGAPEARVTLTGTGLGAGAEWARGLPLAELRVEGSLKGQAAEGTAQLSAGRAGSLTATARLPRGFTPTSPLEATLNGKLDLAPLAQPFLAAGADRVSGRLEVALRAEGSLGTPRLGGRATLSGGDYRNPVTGVRLRDIAGSITGEGTRLVVENLTARTAGQGRITLAGGIDLGAEGFPADLAITARQARPVASDLGTGSFDADLRVLGPVLAGGRVEGEVRIRDAELRVPTSLPANLPVLENVRQVGRAPPGVPQPPRPRATAKPAAPPAPPAPPLALAVTVKAPQGVFVRGRGIDVELGGEVKVGGTVAAPIPSGGLNLRRGTLDILARRMTFKQGSIAFASGNFMPQLDLTAESSARDTTITVTVKGTPAAPEIGFTSSPELPRDEVLARLLFDRPTSNLSPFELAQIAQAVAQLTGIGGGGTSPLDKVRSALGLDRLGVSGGDAGAAPQVEAGRYVAPGVFLGVRQGTQGGQTGVGVQVEITPRLKLEGQTATGPAGDRVGLTYEFEY
ncbi:translocation/assembly module TamB domain-containing protein [Siccirubricoccus sp. KC 17139]|uniref:Translocation/assembly module TamB domain-containing protein n=1 Tax=Siccirubricoccus soli TaxID=2899147 RepID=A0ABT1D3E5_9PROT|nr:translocation/assembly module TamB domain-containing protein [Siccirubricoccus soli]MCO6416453.1 translocation/assembly module TamB domain-containing protein [Siccirubricoccus soli]MCP2682587.1 translocation/assembly module TamB domain-containing protein [Siccirubricoccus soli]